MKERVRTHSDTDANATETYKQLLTGHGLRGAKGDTRSHAQAHTHIRLALPVPRPTLDPTGTPTPSPAAPALPCYSAGARGGLGAGSRVLDELRACFLSRPVEEGAAAFSEVCQGALQKLGGQRSASSEASIPAPLLASPLPRRVCRGDALPHLGMTLRGGGPHQPFLALQPGSSFRASRPGLPPPRAGARDLRSCMKSWAPGADSSLRARPLIRLYAAVFKTDRASQLLFA